MLYCFFFSFSVKTFFSLFLFFCEMIYRPEAGSDIKQETIGDRGMIDHFFPLFLTFY
ncbi:hypothetical protein WN944_010138 [Citrus x changshan-huyou]|uniref:Uncharacterized protein n=1 Tax=Citrus x changshan-huyou TaxID=2935761 RepID=A0AAP0MT27_9ROSI